MFERRVSDMTHNQIEYFKYLESTRHNKVSEAETNRSNLANEQIASGNLSESIRHNIAAETETGRHNQATEQLEQGKLTESIRHNQAAEEENRRHNVAYEDETARHNIATESETNRSNIAHEAIAKDQLSETKRHNERTELISASDVGVKAASKLPSTSTVVTAPVKGAGRGSGKQLALPPAASVKKTGTFTPLLFFNNAWKHGQINKKGRVTDA